MFYLCNSLEICRPQERSTILVEPRDFDVVLEKKRFSSTINKFLMQMLTLEQHGVDLTVEVRGFGPLTCSMRPRPSS